MLTLLPERLSLNRLGGSRRMSLDNSALDRRRWEAEAAAAAAAVATGSGGSPPAEPAVVRSSTPFSGWRAGEAAAGGAPPASQAPAVEESAELSASGALRLQAARRSVDGMGGSGSGWQPQLSCILSDDSGGESSQRSSFDLGSSGPTHYSGGTSSSNGAMSSIPEAAPASMFATAAQTAAQLALQAPYQHNHQQQQQHYQQQQGASQEQQQQAQQAPPSLSILVAEDNLINQRVIRKVLQRVVPSARVDVVGDGAQALAAALVTRYDLILMDIHMPGEGQDGEGGGVTAGGT